MLRYLGEFSLVSPHCIKESVQAAFSETNHCPQQTCQLQQAANLSIATSSKPVNCKKQQTCQLQKTANLSIATSWWTERCVLWGPVLYLALSPAAAPVASQMYCSLLSIYSIHIDVNTLKTNLLLVRLSR